MTKSMMAALLGSVATLGLAVPALAQTSASPFTTATRYDAERRVTGTIAPDPDGTDPLNYAAVRTSYDVAGRLVKIEKGELAGWQSEAIAPSAWSDFTIFETTDISYDGLDRRVREDVTTGSKTTVAQYSYDAVGRLKCTAVRMNVAEFATLVTDACSLDTNGTQGADRITQYSYDPVGQLVKVRNAVGTPLEQDYVNYGYTANGKQKSVIDANGNKATMTYDGFDRLIAWTFPSKTTVGAVAGCTTSPTTEVGGITSPPETRVSGDDCEKYAYDKNGNRAKLMKRDGSVIAYSYDPLNRMTLKDIPGGTAADVYYAYDLRGLQTEARFGSLSGQGVSNGYDGLGRLTSSTINMGTARTFAYEWDAGGNRTKITHPDSQYFTYEYDGLDRMIRSRENGGTTLVRYDYRSDDQIGAIVRPNSANTDFSYGTDRRRSSIAHDFASTTSDVTFGFSGYNPANQVTQRTRDNDSFAFPAYVTASTSYTANGLNQYSAVGAVAPSHDLNGNMTSDGTTTYAYDVENRLISATGGVALSYDPFGRLYQITSVSGVRQFLYDGDDLVAEYSGGGTLQRRWAHGQGDDSPLAWYEGATVSGSNRRLLHTDHLGSIVAFSSNAGNATVNRYDEYGNPAPANVGMFQYTGQLWLIELGAYYYKSRVYSPRIGRFLQVDPIGYGDDLNLYSYVGNDPVNRRDPTGTETGSLLPGGGCAGLIVSCHTEYGPSLEVRPIGVHKQDEAEGDKVTTKTEVRTYRWGKRKVSKEEYIALCAATRCKSVVKSGVEIEGKGPLYRNGRSRVRPARDVDLDPDTGLVMPTKGISLNTDPKAARSFGPAQQVREIPRGLTVRHTGGTHYELVPEAPMPLEKYSALVEGMNQ